MDWIYFWQPFGTLFPKVFCPQPWPSQRFPCTCKAQIKQVLSTVVCSTEHWWYFNPPGCALVALGIGEGTTGTLSSKGYKLISQPHCLRQSFAPWSQWLDFRTTGSPAERAAALSTGILACGGWKTRLQRVCFGPTIQGWLSSASSTRLLFQQWKTEGGKRWTQSRQHTKAKTHIADISAAVGYTG